MLGSGSKFYQKKIAVILLISSYIFGLALFSGTIDAFVPKHIAYMLEISQRGIIIEGLSEQNPAFYILGAMLINICNFSGFDLLFAPIQIIPYLVILFALVYKISGNYILSAIIPMIDIFSEVTGTPKIYFWPHGIGTILLFTFLLLAIFLLLDSKKSGSVVISILFIGTSVIFISYNIAFIILLLLGLICLLLITRDILLGNQLHITLKKQSHMTFLAVLLVMLIIQLGLSNFVYSFLFPNLQFVLYEDLSAYEKFIAKFLSPDLITNPMSIFLLSKPFSLIYLGLLKYAVVFSSIALCLINLTTNFIHSRKIEPLGIFILSLLVTYSIFTLSRFFLLNQGIMIIYFVLPGIFCLCILYRERIRIGYPVRYFIVLSILVLLFVAPMSLYVNYDGGAMNTNLDRYASLQHASKFYYDKDFERIAISDEFTKNFFILTNGQNALDLGAATQFEKDYYQYRVMKETEMLGLIKSKYDPFNEVTIIINYNLNTLSMQNWQTLKSWRFFQREIDSNMDINKVYSVSNVCVYIN